MTCLTSLGTGGQHYLPYGEVVAVARLADAVQCPSERVRPNAYGDFSRGRWAWILEDVHALKEPVSVRGRQGVWLWPPPATVRKELDGVVFKRMMSERVIVAQQHESPR